MILDLSSAIAVGMLAIPFLLLLMLVPVALELRKPRDAGPRSIMSVPLDSVSESQSLTDNEENKKPEEE